jgi:hypothetical protein
VDPIEKRGFFSTVVLAWPEIIVRLPVVSMEKFTRIPDVRNVVENHTFFWPRQ